MMKIERKDFTKKEWKEKAKQNRVLVGFNTGIRTFKDKKHPTRAEMKRGVCYE